MEHHERREFVFVDDLVVAEHFFGAFARPAEVLDSPMDEDPLERLGLGEADRAVFLRVLQSQECCAQHGRMREIGMVIRKWAELDHVPFMAQAERRCQAGGMVGQGAPNKIAANPVPYLRMSSGVAGRGRLSVITALGWGATLKTLSWR